MLERIEENTHISHTERPGRGDVADYIILLLRETLCFVVKSWQERSLCKECLDVHCHLAYYQIHVTLLR